MTKEQLFAKWTINPDFKYDLNAVIATEIAKIKEQPQPALNEIEKAYHNYEPIRWILWNKGWNIKKHSDTESIDEKGSIYDNKCIVFNFDTNPEEWELYTEPTEQVAEPTEQPAKPFDRDRFEAMFQTCAIIGNKDGKVPTWDSIFSATEQALNKLDAYYATKEGGSK